MFSQGRKVTSVWGHSNKTTVNSLHVSFFPLRGLWTALQLHEYAGVQLVDTHLSILKVSVMKQSVTSFSQEWLTHQRGLLLT